MKVQLIFVMLMTSANAKAVFQKIWKGYQVSSLNQSYHLDAKINEANFEFDLNKYDWKLEFTPMYDNTYLDGLFSFQSVKTIKDSLTFGLSKPSYKWGTFSLQHIRTTYDLSFWSEATLANLPSDKLFETKNVVGYTYDFLDRSLDNEFELVTINKTQGDFKAKLNIDQGYFDFFTVYLQAKLQVFSVELNKEFEKRSLKRVKLIQNRVRDGLSRKVELIQAKSNLLGQQEAIERSRSALKQNLAILENIVGRKIDESYFTQIMWKNNPFSYWQKFITPTEHYSLEVLRQSLEYSEKMLEKLSNQSGYKLTLNAAYISNDIDENSAESLNNSLQGQRDSKNISLNFIIPLGGDKNEGLRKKYIYQKKKNELDLLTKKDELKSKKDALLDQIQYLQKGVMLAQEQVKISNQILLELNKLYLRGQATFEEVIRAEENYINAELSEKRLLADYEMLIGNYAFLNNSIKAILDVYQD